MRSGSWSLLSSVLALTIMVIFASTSAAAPEGSSPSAVATVQPFVAPTIKPFVAPTLAPFVAPTLAPFVAPTLAPFVAPTVQPYTAMFKLGFKAVADQIPDVVGSPTEDEHYGSNGDSLQQTTKGLMAWRKADNWTAFTNGATTWINGPVGIQSRSNDQRFPWESDGQPAQPATPPNQAPSGSGLDFFFHTYALAIPGGSYTVDDYANFVQKMYSGAGTIGNGMLAINPDGTYEWASNRERRVISGSWEPSSERDGYPIKLKDGQSNVDWYVARDRTGFSQDGTGITVWDGKTQAGQYRGKVIQ